jgi:predicted regulator of Ras-like GTPase activity (Roadblock/LC7/MglB family)
MSFEPFLKAVHECRGVIATAISDTDGIAVETWGGMEDEVEELIAEYSTFLRDIVSANRELQLGELEQLQVTGDRRIALVTLITGLYFLLTIVNRDGNPGKARFRSRVAAQRLRSEFV